MDRESFDAGVSNASVGIGLVAVVAPGGMLRAYGASSSPETRNLLRMIGTRTVLLGALFRLTPQAAREQWRMPLAALGAADAISNLAAIRGGVPRRAAVLTSATAAFFGALAPYGRSLSPRS